MGKFDKVDKSITIDNFKKKMTEKAKKLGIYEDFGQAEISYITDKYKSNPYGSQSERNIAAKISELNDWCMNFDMSNLKENTIMKKSELIVLIREEITNILKEDKDRKDRIRKFKESTIKTSEGINTAIKKMSKKWL